MKKVRHCKCQWGAGPPRPRSLGSPATAPLASMNSQAPVVKQSSPESFGSANPFIPFGGLLMRSEVRFSAYRPLFCSKREIREATGEQDDIAERAGSAGFQRLRPHGDARPPHEQGAGALRFGSDGAAAGADGGRPTSRGLPPAKVCVGRRCLAPRGQGGAAGVRRRRCLPLRGKSASELARLFWFAAGENRKSGRFAHHEWLAGAPGDESCGALQGVDHCLHYPAPGKRARASSYLFTTFSRPQKPASRSFRNALFPLPSRGETGGLCPHPLKGSIP